MLLAADVAPIDALAHALKRQGMTAVPIFVSSLKDPAVIAFVERAAASLLPAAIVTATAFASGAEPGSETLFDRIGIPVFQAFVATTRRDAWMNGQRGLAPADLAMHVVLPELDGRILAGAIGFKGERATDDALAFRGFFNRPEPDRVEQVAARIAAMVRLQQTPRKKRRIAILMPDYPGAAGRTGYAVGLDVPSSVLAMLHDLNNAGYTVDAIPQSPRALLDVIERGEEGLGLVEYRALTNALPVAAMAAVEEAWGQPDRTDAKLSRPSSPTGPSPRKDGEKGKSATSRSASFSPSFTGRRSRQGDEGQDETLDHESVEPIRAFPFRAARFGNVIVALAPDRGRSQDRRADYHDPRLPPRHALVAFGLWLQKSLGCHALVHVGAHGTLEWLPGKTVALSENCFPEIVTGGLPVVYPFIVSNPGEAAQAKRRIAAVTVGHLPPPLTGAGLDERSQALERLVDEYAQADGLDRRRRDRLAKLIVEKARETGLAGEAGSAATKTLTRRCSGSMPGSATSRISRSRTGCTSTAATRPTRPTRYAP